MSGSNAIHGIILVGAMFIASQAQGAVQSALAFIAVFLATLNIVGGVVVTDRMLDMFKSRQQRKPFDPKMEPKATPNDDSRHPYQRQRPDGRLPAVCRLLHLGPQSVEFAPHSPLWQPGRRRRDGGGRPIHVPRPAARA